MEESERNVCFQYLNPVWSPSYYNKTRKWNKAMHSNPKVILFLFTDHDCLYTKYSSIYKCRHSDYIVYGTRLLYYKCEI